jgi:hypothetical protein
VEIFYDQQGHLGCGVVTFSTSEDAKAVDHSFKTVQFGQQEYIEDHQHGHLGTHLYGWHATEQDQMNKDQLLHRKIPEFLGTKGDFKNMKTMLHNERRIMTQQVHQLNSEVGKSKSEAWDSQVRTGWSERQAGRY